MRQRIHPQPHTPHRIVIPRPVVIIPRLFIQLLRIKPVRRIVCAAVFRFLGEEAFAKGGIIKILIKISISIGDILYDRGNQNGKNIVHQNEYINTPTDASVCGFLRFYTSIEVAQGCCGRIPPGVKVGTPGMLKRVRFLDKSVRVISLTSFRVRAVFT